MRALARLFSRAAMTATKPSFEARAHVARVLEQLPASDSWPRVLFLRGETIHIRGTDLEMPFRQDAHFIYLTGAHDIPDCSLVVAARSKSDFTSTLFIADVDPDSVMWSGLPPSPEQVQQRFDVDEVKTASDLVATLAKLLGDKATLYTLDGVKLPEGVKPASHTDTTGLLAALSEARTVKTAGEIELMRRASEISSQAHADVMAALGRGELTGEPDADAVFRASCLKAGAKHLAYQTIVAVGPHASTLHYIDNSAPFPKEPALLLLDAGAEYDGYAADITRTIPIGNGGRFTEDAAAIYDIVLRMQDESLAMIKAGVDWRAVHLRAHQVAARGLLDLGILHAGPSSAQGDALIDELVAKGATLWAFPHGLGHLLGLDVHDVGGLPDGRASDPLYRYLRLLRNLEIGWVVTVEPGVYFNEHLIAAAKPEAMAHVNKRLIEERYMRVGGVRIEDNVLITRDGYENLTTAPKTRAAVEALCVKAA